MHVGCWQSISVISAYKTSLILFQPHENGDELEATAKWCESESLLLFNSITSAFSQIFFNETCAILLFLVEVG
jgi:hypothetical protein